MMYSCNLITPRPNNIRLLTDIAYLGITSTRIDNGEEIPTFTYTGEKTALENLIMDHFGVAPSDLKSMLVPNNVSEDVEVLIKDLIKTAEGEVGRQRYYSTMNDVLRGLHELASELSIELRHTDEGSSKSPETSFTLAECFALCQSYVKEI